MDPTVLSIQNLDLGLMSHAGSSDQEHTVPTTSVTAACEASLNQQLPVLVSEAKDSLMTETSSTLHENNHTARGPHSRNPSVSSDVTDYGSLPGLASGSSSSGGLHSDADMGHPRVGDSSHVAAISSLPSRSMLTPMPQPQPTAPPPWQQRGQARAAPLHAATPSSNRHRHSWRSDSSSSTGSLPPLVDDSSSFGEEDGGGGWESSDGSIPGLLEDTDSDSDSRPPLVRSSGSSSSSDGEGGEGGSHPGRRVRGQGGSGGQPRGAQAAVNRRDVLNRMVNHGFILTRTK